MHLRLAIRDVALAAFLAAVGTAQTVWNVPAGNPIQPVVDGASPGDIVVLTPGATYATFTLNKGLTVIGPATIGTPTGFPAQVFDIPAGQVGRLIDTIVEPPVPPLGFPGFTTEVRGGVMAFEGCTFRNSPGTFAALRSASARVVLDHCVVDGSIGVAQTFGNATCAFAAEDSDVVATNCDFLGPAGAFFSVPGVGIRFTGAGSLHLSHCTVLGGAAGGLVAEFPPQSAIWSTVPAWITDSTITGGDGGSAFPGAPGITTTAATEVARSTISAGSGFLPSPATDGPVTTNPQLLGVRSSNPTTVGGPLTITFTADQAGIGITALASEIGLVPPVSIPVLAQPLWATSLFVAGSLTTDATGEAALAVTVPNAPGLQFESFDFFGARIAGAQVQLSPVVPVTVL